MRISVVIPVRNRPELIARCVEAVQASAAQPGAPLAGEWEVVVVDNGSTDDTAARAARAGARVVQEPQPNRCRARNAGASAATGDWIAFIDSDCEPEPGWLPALAAAIAAHEAGGADTVSRCEPIFAGAVISGPPTNHVERYFDERGWFDQQKYLNPPPGMGEFRPFAISANLCVRRAYFIATGGFDTALRHAGEDADWCWRATMSGNAECKMQNAKCEKQHSERDVEACPFADPEPFAQGELHYLPAARVIHHHRATWGGLWRQSREWGRGQAELFAKWPPVFDAEGAAAASTEALRGGRGRVGARYLRWALGGLARGVMTMPLALPGTDRWRRQFTFRRALPWLDATANLGLFVGRCLRCFH